MTLVDSPAMASDGYKPSLPLAGTDLKPLGSFKPVKNPDSPRDWKHLTFLYILSFALLLRNAIGVSYLKFMGMNENSEAEHTYEYIRTTLTLK